VDLFPRGCLLLHIGGDFPRKSLCLFYFLTSGIRGRVRHIVFIHIVAGAAAGFCLRRSSRIMSTKFDILKFDGKISFSIWWI
jgi:hypothetical protein